MIEALVRECSDVAGVARLFEELGYPVETRSVGIEALTALGLTVPRHLPVYHLFRYGGIDLYVARALSDEDRASLRELEAVLAERNHVTKPVIVELGDEFSTRLAIHARSGRSRRRIDVDIAHPSSDVIDRICSLGIRREGPFDVDPGLLFDRVLDREALGRRFFEQFRKSVRRVTDALCASSAPEQTAEGRSQALLLLSRVLFIYLVQRKGWLAGDHRFLRERLSTCVRRRRSFHSTVLEPLFFDCLNTPRSKRSPEAKRLGSIPYLNGGLFEPSSFELRNGPVELPNELWEDVLDSTFEAFSLSVAEGDDEGAHVDPEMLGRVFEKLMESEERARTGSFYTPRQVVDRLTTSAIVRWCSGGDSELASSLRRLACGEMVTIDLSSARSVLRRLKEISVLDPACGSGAFLLAALRTIESLTRSLMKIADEVPPHDLRSKISASALFGVDLKMEAVRLCELRIWLAIVAGSDYDADSVPPLPNLDRNILQGNSLLGPVDFLAERRGEIYHGWMAGLRDREKLIAAYRHSSSSERRGLTAQLRASDESLARTLLTRSVELDREELRVLAAEDRGLFAGAPELSGKKRARVEKRLESTTRLLDRLEQHEIGFFSFELHFADILARGGFSVVLGNPPWVRGSRIDPELRKLLADRYRSFESDRSGGFRQAELAMAFVERSLSLCAPGGVIAQLVPSKITSAEYARAVRRELTTEAAVEEVIDLSTEGKRLFGADVFPLGIVATKTRATSGTIEILAENERNTIGRRDLSVDGPGSAWSTAPPGVREVIGRIRQSFAPLAEVLGRRPVMGVKTGANRKFFRDDVEVLEKGVLLADVGLELPRGAVVRTVRGRDLRRWKATDSTWMLWPPALAGDPRVRKLLAERIGVDVRVLRLGYVRSEHLGLKIAWKDVSRGLNAAILPDQVSIGGVPFSVVPNQTLYSLDVATRDEGLAIGALLNSTVLNALALETAERAKDHHWRYMAVVVGALPFPRLTPGSDQYRTLVKVARRAESGLSDECELNRFVAGLYGVSRVDLEVLEAFVRQRLGQRSDAR